jgi:hypothetical protein
MQLLMPYLDAGLKLQEFGDRKRAEAGVRYAHQVVRALGALHVWNAIEPMHVGKVVALGRSEHPRVRAAAFTAMSKLPPALVPWRELWPMTRTGSDADRRLAFATWSYSGHPQVFLDLHRVALDASDPCREVAISRLRDLADPFSEHELKDAAAAAPPGPHRDALSATAAAIGRATREAEAQGQNRTSAARVEQLVERAAFTELSKDARAAKVAEWAEAELQRGDTALVQAFALDLHDSYRADRFQEPERATMLRKVKSRLERLAVGTAQPAENRQR